MGEAQKRLLATLITTIREPVLAANPAFCSAFAIPSEQIQGRLFALNNHQWDLPALRELLEKTLPQNDVVDGFELNIPSEQGQRRLSINARRVVTAPDQPILFLLVFQEQSA